MSAGGVKKSVGRVALVATAVLLAACSSSTSASPQSRLLSRMHQLVPDVPSRAIIADASKACSRPTSLGELALQTQSKAAATGVDGLRRGSPALHRYILRLAQVTQDVGYC